jgi:predicted MFS family arabinose efflux permease
MSQLTRARGLSAILLGIAVGWGAGNIGPVVTQLAHSFHVSLAGVGLLSGTVYFAAAIGAATMTAGHAVFAASPDYAGLVLARILVGVGCAFSLIAGPVMARELGGVRLLGLFGGAISLGIAASLGLGSLLEDAGVNWRVGFVISAAVNAAPLLALPKRLQGAPAARPDRAFVMTALRSGALWRLLVLFVAVNGVPLIVGAWLVAYLTRDVSLRTAVAGGLAFVVFGLTTVVRPLGARFAGGGARFSLLTGGGSLVATAGLIVLAASKSVGVALVAVVLLGIGFALPYAVMVDAAQRLFPDRATSTLAVVQTGPNVVPMIVIPFVGSALDHGHAPLAFVLLAAFVGLAGIANLIPPTRRQEAAAPSRA